MAKAVCFPCLVTINLGSPPSILLIGGKKFYLASVIEIASKAALELRDVHFYTVFS